METPQPLNSVKIIIKFVDIYTDTLITIDPTGEIIENSYV